MYMYMYMYVYFSAKTYCLLTPGKVINGLSSSRGEAVLTKNFVVIKCCYQAGEGGRVRKYMYLLLTAL